MGFKPTVPVSEHPQTHAFDHTATGIGLVGILALNSRTENHTLVLMGRFNN
jgi:hypothetical protein